MKYKGMSALEFRDIVSRGGVNLEEFYIDLFSELARLNRNYSFLRTVSEEKPEKMSGKLSGVPVTAKDCICTRNIETTAGSRILEGYVPPFDATCIERVRSEGGEIVGKTNQDEFGFGTFSTNSGFGIPRNPIDPSRSCGGSSGGAAGLTKALEMPHIAIGESTGGSISCPASFCGVAGLTPTYGLVSRYGHIDYANSLDKIGAIGKTAEDVALLLSVMAGRDPRDQTTAERKPEDYVKYTKDSSVKNLKIGVPEEYFGEGVDPEVSKRVWEGIKKMEDGGASYGRVSLPGTDYAVAAYYIIATAEASTNLARYCGMRYGREEKTEGEFNEYFSRVRSRYLGREAKRRILLGTFTRMAGYRDQYYLKAMKARTLIINEFRSLFRKHDILVAPTMPVIAPKFSEIEKMSPVQNYMMDTLTVAPNLAGIPMLSVPCGKVRGMPVGMHIMGDHFREGSILKAGSAFGSM